jgi:hypothetical protein
MRVNLICIVLLAAPRKRIARHAVLHLDGARSAKKTTRIDSRGNSVNGLSAEGSSTRNAHS